MKPVRKRPRFLPAYVTVFTDRHGKKRYRYRRKGYVGGYFQAQLGTDEFRQEYAAFDASKVDSAAVGNRHPLNSVADLISRYVAEPTRLGPSKVTQMKVRRILGRFQDRYAVGKAGVRYVADFTFEHIDRIIAAEREKKPEGKRLVGGVEAARKLRKELVRLFAYAEKVGMRPVGSNPVKLAEPVRVTAGEKSKGHHSWTEAEIAAYRAVHHHGTSARLALELLLWTGQRRGDGYRFCPADVTDGCFVVDQDKGGKAMVLPLAPQLLAAITAMPPMPGRAKAYLLTSFGKPYSYAGFGNAMRKWCDDAGLPHCAAHGLRKANARRLAELGMNNQTLKAVGGWTNDREVAIYTAAADQARLARLAMTTMADWEAGRASNLERLTDPKLLPEPQES
jgi:integrase